MPTDPPPEPPAAQTVSGKDKVAINVLLGIVTKVVEGLRAGSIKAPPVIDMSNPEAENYDMMSLEEYIWKRLGTIGIQEAKPSQEPPNGKAAPQADASEASAPSSRRPKRGSAARPKRS